MKVQAIACLSCGTAELIREDSERLTAGKWPAWEPGPQAFPCPYCGEESIWAAEPREVIETDPMNATVLTKETIA